MPQRLPSRYVTTKNQQVRSTMQHGWLKLWTRSCRDPALTWFRCHDEAKDVTWPLRGRSSFIVHDISLTMIARSPARVWLLVPCRLRGNDVNTAESVVGRVSRTMLQRPGNSKSTPAIMNASYLCLSRLSCAYMQ